MYAANTDSSFTLTFIGSAMCYHSDINPNGGQASITLDSGDTTIVDESVDAYEGEEPTPAILWYRTGLNPSESHTMSLSYVGSGELGGGYVELYYLEYTEGGTSSASVPSGSVKHNSRWTPGFDGYHNGAFEHGRGKRNRINRYGHRYSQYPACERALKIYGRWDVICKCASGLRHKHNSRWTGFDRYQSGAFEHGRGKRNRIGRYRYRYSQYRACERALKVKHGSGCWTRRRTWRPLPAEYARLSCALLRARKLSDAPGRRRENRPRKADVLALPYTISAVTTFPTSTKSA